MRLRNLIPFSVRVEFARLKRLPAWWLEMPTIARTRLPLEEQTDFRHLLACHSSPLERIPGTSASRLQHGKELNVSLAVQRLDGLLVRPYELFSYHHCVGRPSRLRGFRLGLELHDGATTKGLGGGCCQISNALYLLALRGGMKIVERHRHGLDL